VYKTQVFLNHEGDLFRTRLTHSLEVAQLGRSIARSLGLNEDLVEGISLAHDLGHTPFGHAGQDALHACMETFGGFEHNLQSLRVVDVLEERYPQFDGLNLCFETREGILKHCSKSNAQAIEAQEPNGVAWRFLNQQSASLEAQLCNLADEIAYNAHDIDDGVRSGLISLEQLEAAVPLVRHFMHQALVAYPQLKGRRLLSETIRLMLCAQVYDVIDTTQSLVKNAGVASVDEVRQHRSLVRFSDDMRAQSTALKQFLLHQLYRHPQVEATMALARQVIRDLFDSYMHTLPDTCVRREGDSPARSVADYIAGMTDRYALSTHAKLTGQSLFSQFQSS
jgi:dGTPase